MSSPGGELIPSLPVGPPLLYGLALGLVASLCWGRMAWRAAEHWARVVHGRHPDGPHSAEVSTGMALATSALLGPMFLGWLGLLVLWSGLRLSSWVALTLALLGAGFLWLVRVRSGRSAPPIPTPDRRRGPKVIKWSDFVPIILFLTASVAAIFILAMPTTDYDGLTLWSYRTRVFVREGIWDTPALFDPLRLVAMREHPYLLPSAEALWCVGAGGFSWMGQRGPHALMVLGWVMLAASAWRPLGICASWRWVVAGALLAMPAATLGPWFESAREPLIGMLLGFATLLLVQWMRDPGAVHALLIGALAAALAQQIKVEGTPGLAGFFAAMTVTAFLEPWSAPESRLRRSAYLRALLILGVVILPWELIRRGLENSPHGYDVTTGLTHGWDQRVDAILLVLRLTLTEMFFRPEIHAFSLTLALATTVFLMAHSGVSRRWRDWCRAACAFLPALCILVAVGAVYVVRQEQLPMERNLTYSRRMFAVMPGLLVAVLALPALLGREPVHDEAPGDEGADGAAATD